MARFEWLTPERAIRTWGVAAGLLLLGGGVGNVWLASVTSGGLALFGADGFLLTGVGQIAAGAFFLASEYLRQPISSADAE